MKCPLEVNKSGIKFDRLQTSSEPVREVLIVCLHIETFLKTQVDSDDCPSLLIIIFSSGICTDWVTTIVFTAVSYPPLGTDYRISMPLLKRHQLIFDERCKSNSSFNKCCWNEQISKATR